MRNHLFLYFAFVLLSGLANAQNSIIYSTIPESFSYEAFAVDANSSPLIAHNISLRASILENSSTGTVLYVERFQITTNDEGYFQIRIGEGVYTGGYYQSFEDIDWNGTHYLRMELDITGGNNFTYMEVEPFSSVPYAIKSAVADSISGISLDTLNRVASQFGVCLCSLQEAYDIGNTISANSGVFRPVLIGDAANTPLQDLLYVGANFPNARPANFEILDPTNTRQAVAIRQEGLAYALQIESGIGSAATSQIINQMGLLRGALWVQSPNTLNPDVMITGYNNGTNHAVHLYNGLLTNQTSTLRVDGGFAGNLSGRAADFLVTSTISVADAVRIQNNGSGTGLRITSQNVNAGNIALFTDNRGNFFNQFNFKNGINGGLSFYWNQNTANAGAVVQVQNDGTGNAGNFLNRFATNNNFAITAIHNFNGGAGFFRNNVNNINNAQPTVSIQPFGLGVGLNVTNANVNNNNFSLVQYTQNSIGPTMASDHTNTASTNPSHVFRSSGRNDVFRISTNANSQLDPGASLLTVQNNVMRNFINTAYFFNASDNSNGVYTVNTATNNSWAGTFINSNPLSTNTTKGLLVGNFGYGDGLYAQSRFGHAAVFMAPGSLESAVEIHGSQGSGANIPLALDVYGATSISGALFVSNGTKSAIINVNGQERAIFCEESPEVWVNDIGVFQLTNGEATVTLSSNFTQIANTNVPYVVFLQLEGDCNSAIKVASKTSTSFRAVAVDSMERINCNCDVAFRISAKRKGFENLNLPTKQEAIIASNNYLQTYGQSVLTYMNNKVNDMNLLNNNFSNFMSQRNNFPFNQNYTTSTFAQPNLPDPIDTVPEEGLLENKVIVPVETNN